MAYDYTAIVNKTLEILKNDRQKKFKPSEVIEKVVRETGCTDLAWMRVTLKTLVAIGKSHGVLSGNSSSLAWIQHKEPENDAEALKEQLAAEIMKVNELDGRVRSLKTGCENAVALLQKERTEFQEKLKTAGKEKIIQVQVKRGEKTVRKVEGIFHDKFPKMLALAQARRNIFIYGPTGSGKTHICEQVAQSLDLPFAFVSCTTGMSESTLNGSLLPTGKGGAFEFIESEFISCYENGGLFLWDEIDAADANVLLLMNSAISNGVLAVQKRRGKTFAKRHPDFVCIAAANTLGTGGDRMYTGRNKLDAATMDRFQIGKVLIDYDLRVEEQLCPDEEIRTRYQIVRKAINAHRLERAVSTRFLIDCYTMREEGGWGIPEFDESLFTGWREEEVNKVKNEIRAKGLPVS